MDIKNLSTEELTKMSKEIFSELSARRDKRKKELWDNVKTTMLKYINECEDIKIVPDDDNATVITKNSFNVENEIHLIY